MKKVCLYSTVVAILTTSAVVSVHAQSNLVMVDGGLEFPDSSLQQTAAASAATEVPVTGLSRCHNASGTEIICNGTGQDGDQRRGVKWPYPRFTKNGDGTVTDHLTGLVWLENANCPGGVLTWDNAIAFAAALADGQCGLSDGSQAGDWRLPNYREQVSLVHYGFVSPAVPNTTGTGQSSAGDPFLNLQTGYWTSTTLAWASGFAHWWSTGGNTSNNVKSETYSAWAVRDPANGNSDAVAVSLVDGGIEFPDGSVQSSAADGYPSPVPKTGQTTSYLVGDDGDVGAGIDWPSPRFTKNGDGTVTDDLTGVIWLEDANCDGQMTWEAALTYANTLFDGSGTHGGMNGDCGLADGSQAGDWRLATIAEFLSLPSYGFHTPTIPDTDGSGQWSEGDPFINLQAATNLDTYWSSTSYPHPTASNWAYVIYSRYGYSSLIDKTESTSHYVWPVRGGS
jgi:hypothetical protein